MNRLILFALALCSAFTLSAQSAFQFTEADATVTLDLSQFQKQLKDAPLEFTERNSNTVVSLPLPDGSFADYEVFESPLVSGYPGIESYKLKGEWGSGRIAVSPTKISVVVKGQDGYFVIDSDHASPSEYRVNSYTTYMERTAIEGAKSSCGNETTNTAVANIPTHLGEVLGAAAGAGFEIKSANEVQPLRVYEVLMSCTGEFAQDFGSTILSVVDAFNTVFNALNTVYENEFGVRLMPKINEDLIFLDGATDPFTDPARPGGLLNQNLALIRSLGIPIESYDLGHIMTAGCEDGATGPFVAGTAEFSSVCGERSARAASCVVGGQLVNTGLGVMAHEIGHQFAASHTFNRCDGSAGLQRRSETAFEPGGGATIMAYPGACDEQNTTRSRADYFHVSNQQQIREFVTIGPGSSCPDILETDNFSPEVDFSYEDGFSIPISTPFRLIGSATDANDDQLAYNWEQYDLGPESRIDDPRGDAPIFRSVPPSPNGNVRLFSDVLRDISFPGQPPILREQEVLPTYSRNLTFRLTARDNNPEAGGIDWKEVHFLADEVAGPFIVNDPLDTEWEVGDYQEVTWDVANTDQAPVNCQIVNILASTDGGDNYDIVLAEDVVNSGTAFVTVPERAVGNNVLIMVEAVDNIFLNWNENAFSVSAATQPVFTLESDIRYQNICLPDVLSINLNSGSVLGFDSPISLSVEIDNLPEGTVASLSDTEIMPGSSSTLEVDLGNVNFTGRTELTVVAVAEGQDTARRVITLDLVSNDYADLVTNSPVEGTTGIILATEFDWTDAINADSYDIQIGTSPTFSEETLFEEAVNLTNTDYIPAEFFEPNTLYFWRIRPVNSCGAGDWLDPNSFRTVNSQCESYMTDSEVTLPGTGPSFSRESTIFIEEQGTINDINIPNVNIRYNFASNVKVSLISPAGTEVVLYNESCFGSTNRIDLGFDDDAPVTVACPPDDERVFIPTGTLADFNGEDTFGEWILKVDVSETGGSAGSIESWQIEFCADISAVAPERISNLATEVPPLGRNSITGDKLRITSPIFSSGEVEYQLTSLPAAGRLTLYGTELSIGDVFQQDDINGNGLFYENTDGEATTDDFGFVVTTPDGGYLAIDYHDILVTEDATVSNGNVSVLEDNLKVFPNPTAGDLNLRWTATVSRNLSLELYDLNGRLLNRQMVNGRAGAARISTDALPAGIYLLRIDGAVRRVVKR